MIKHVQSTEFYVNLPQRVFNVVIWPHKSPTFISILILVHKKTFQIMNNRILYNQSEFSIPLHISTELKVYVVSNLDTKPITLSFMLFRISLTLNHLSITLQMLHSNNDGCKTGHKILYFTYCIQYVCLNT